MRLWLSALAALLAAAAAALLLPGALADTVVPGGTINTSTTWDLPGSPYILEGDVTVNSTAVLTISAGVSVRVDTDFGLIIRGGLQVQGTAGSPVSFSANASAARWSGITFAGSAMPSAVRNATVSKTIVGIRVDAPAAPVSLSDVDSSQATLWAVAVENTAGNFSATNLRVSNSGEGLRLYRSDNLAFNGLRADAMLGFVVNSTAYRYGINASLANSIVFTALNFTDAWVFYSTSSDVQFHNVRMQRINSTSGETGMYLFNLVRPRFTNTTVIDYNVGLTFSGGTEIDVSGLAGARTRFSPVSAGMSILLDSGGATGRVTGLTATDLSSYALYVSGSGLTVDNATVAGSAGGIWGSCSCTFDNISISNATNGVVLSAFAPSGQPATLRNVAVDGALNPFLVGPAPGVREAHDIDMRNNVTIDGVLVVTLYKETNPAPLTGGPFPFVYVYGITGLDVRDLLLSPSVSGTRVVLANVANGTFTNASFAGRNALSVYFSRNMTFSNISLSSIDGAVYVNNSDRLRFENSTFSTATGGPRTADRMTNTTWSRVTVVGAALWEVGGADNRYEFSDLRAGISIHDGLRMNVRDTRVCLNSTTVGLRWDRVIGGTVQNITGCPGSATIVILSSNDVFVTNNTIDGAAIAIELVQGTRVHIRWNEIRNSTTVGIYVLGGAGAQNYVFENELYNNTVQALDEAATGGVQWWNQTTRRGNYWSEYRGQDTNGDILGDAPYNVGPLTRQDRFPLMYPWDPVPPVARMWLGTTVDEDAMFLLDASNSTDNRGFVRAEWKLTLHRRVTTLPGLVINVSFLDPGVADVQLTVFDSWNVTAVLTATVTVFDVTPPVVRITTPLSVDENTPLWILANVTDNDVLFPAGSSYLWEFTGGWKDQYAWFNTTDHEIQLAFGTPGTYAGRLTASDAAGNNVTENFTVVVRDTTRPLGQFRAFQESPVTERDLVSFTMLNVTDEDPAFVAASAVEWNVTGPHGFTLTSTNLLFSFTVPLPGNYTLTYAVFDLADPANVFTDTYAFYSFDGFSPDWTPPARIDGVDRDLINLSALDAHDSSGVRTVVWSEGPTVLATGAYVSVRIPVPGDHLLGVELKDAYGHSSNFTVLVRVKDTTPPFLTDASLTALQTVEQHVQASWDASAAFGDLDRNFPVGATYRWVADAFDAEWLSAPDDADARVRFPTMGAYFLMLTVADAAGNTLNVTLPVHVIDGEAPVWTPPSGLSVADGAALVLNALDAQDGGAIVLVRWSHHGVTLAMGMTATVVLTGLGVQQIDTTITDARGHVAIYSFNVTVLDATRPRFVDASFTGERTVPQDVPLWLDATGAFEDNDPTFPATGVFDWQPTTGGVTFPDGSRGQNVSAVFDLLGAQTLTLRVADRHGNWVHVNITVMVVDGRPPAEITWNVGPDLEVALGEFFYFTVSATDDSDIVYYWAFGDGDTAQGQSVDHAFDATGVYTVTVTAADARGNEANKTFELTVVAAQAQAPADQTMPLVLAALVAGAGVGAFLLARQRLARRPPPTK